MNLRQFAKISGFAVSTVSKTFSDSKEISNETKNLIISKAKELGVFEKFKKTKPTEKTISIICPEIKSAYYTEILSELNYVLDKKNIKMLVAVTNFYKKREEDLISYFSLNKNVNGIIIFDGKTIAKKYAEIPIVYTNSENSNIYADVINTDFTTGIDEAISMFKNNGHTKIAYVGEKLTNDKLTIFLQSLKKQGLTIDENLIYVSDKRFEEAGFESMEKMFKKDYLPTAILAAYDYIALGIIRSIEKHNKTVPDDFSIIGIDDIKIASFHNISLSSINANTKEICNLAIDLLMKKIENKNYKLVQNISIKTFVNDKNSVKNINKN